MKLHSLREGWRIALDQLRANKLRSALTVLGVVIGIATVMAMASIVAGFREQIVNTLEVVGPTTFRVLRYFSATGVNPDAVPREVRIRPKLLPQDAEAIARLPEIHYAAIWTQVFQRFEYGGNHTRILGVFGADDRFMEILGGGLTYGRSFIAPERRGGAVRSGAPQLHHRRMERPHHSREAEAGGQRQPRDGCRHGDVAAAPRSARRRRQHVRFAHVGSGPEYLRQSDVCVLLRDAGALEHRVDGGRHRSHGDHDGVGDKPHP